MGGGRDSSEGRKGKESEGRGGRKGGTERRKVNESYSYFRPCKAIEWLA